MIPPYTTWMDALNGALVHAGYKELDVSPADIDFKTLGPHGNIEVYSFNDPKGNTKTIGIENRGKEHILWLIEPETKFKMRHIPA